MRNHRMIIGAGHSALARYGERAGHLVERHIAEAALIAARQEAERKAAEALMAKSDLETANLALQEEMAIRTRTQSRLTYLASHDPLTALPNRTLFSERLGQAMDEARAHGRKLALLYVDLDNFKYVNDTLGHAAGDTLLQYVSGRLESELRTGETVARMGGDEFAVLQLELEHVGQARSLAERLIAKLAQRFDLDKKAIFIGASIGITVFPDDASTVQALHRNADLAMYRAKNDGRNRYQFFDESLNEETNRLGALEQALREPDVTAQMKLMFQPQVDMRDQRVTGVEALLRWDHPELGAIAPGNFIPIAERSGVIGDIGAWVLREACRQAVRWRDAGLERVIVAVNVATAQFRDGNIPRLVAQTLESTGLDPSWLELEITETGIMHDVHIAAETLVALHAMGVSLAIDDFGTGYSSLSYLRRLPVDRIKIDQSFVNDVPDSEDASAVVSTIVKLAHNLRLEVVAEGVETAEQSEFVRQTGCNFGQGYYYGSPAYAQDLAALTVRPRNLERVP